MKAYGITFILALFAGVVRASTRRLVSVTELQLGGTSDAIADLYYVGGTGPAPPLIVFATGGSILKDGYTIMGNYLARKGYAVMVVQDVAAGPGGAQLSAVTPLVFKDAIEFAETQTEFDIDTDTVILMGHSFGSTQVFFSLAEVCPFGCGPPGPPVPVSLPSNVKAALVYGFNLYNPQTDSYFTSVSKGNFPFFVLNGAGDTITLETPPGDRSGITQGQGTYELLDSTAVYAVLEDADHYSICDEFFVNPGSVPREDEVSQLPREQQVATVVEILDSWIQDALIGDVADKNHCEKIFDMGKDAFIDFTLAECLEK